MPLKASNESSKDEAYQLLPGPPLRPTTVSQKRSRIGRAILLILSLFAIQIIIKSISTVWNQSKAHRFNGHGRPACASHHHHHDMPESIHKRPLNTSEIEALFLSIPSAESAINASRLFASHPHLAGSEQDLEDAKAVLAAYQTAFGIKPCHHGHDTCPPPIFPAGSKESRHATLSLTDRHILPHAPVPTAWIDVYYPVLNTPLNHSLEIIGEDGIAEWTADLEEDGDELDELAHKYKDTISSWHGLSKDGDVKGQLVYANYGSKEDYDELVSKGVDLKDKIVLVRYGGNFRGLKIKGAEELGAAGVLIFSDPRDDGSVTVQNGYKPYPHGPARNPTSVQRGSVQYLSLYPGDPTTPGVPAYEDAERTESSNVPSIPSLPISWANAERLLEEIDSDPLTALTLSGSSSKKTVRLVNHVDTKVTPIWNAMAAIPGHIRNEVVVLGNHRDAWVMGAADPTSGTASMNEVIRGFGELLKSGWQPLRTIVFASWDAEEYGLIGSTEWGEDFPDWISEHVVAYLNVDVSVSGSKFGAQGSPSLAHLLRQTAQDIDHPTEPQKTLWDARQDSGSYLAPGEDVTEDVKIDSVATGVRPLGSGSDYTVFLQRLGVASINTGFSATRSDPVYHYHSIYDTHRFQEVYADPGFSKHVAISKFIGLLGLRIIDTPILPLNTTQYALELEDYLDQVEEIPIALDEQPLVAFSALRQSIHKLQHASLKLDKERQDAWENLDKIVKKLPGHLAQRATVSFKIKKVFCRIKRWFRSLFALSNHHEHHHVHDREHHSRSRCGRHTKHVKHLQNIETTMGYLRVAIANDPEEPAYVELMEALVAHHHEFSHRRHHAHHKDVGHNSHEHAQSSEDHEHALHHGKGAKDADYHGGRHHYHCDHGHAHTHHKDMDHNSNEHAHSLEDHEHAPHHGKGSKDADHHGGRHQHHKDHKHIHAHHFKGKSLKSHFPHLPKPFPIKFIKAVKRLSRANQKLAAFEKGFISEEGIKDREWYKHLGVAPGKWLGYGATTLPGLTEAITIEKNITMASYEADRLTKLIDRLTETIAV